MKKSTKITWGIALIVIGVYVALNRLNVIAFDVIFGGVTNKRTQTSEPNAPVVYVNAFSMFGGVTIQ
jgi:hypothetical protein